MAGTNEVAVRWESAALTIILCVKVHYNSPIFSSTQHNFFDLVLQDFFVFDVVEDHVFVVINHLRNLSNMYVSDMSGLKYQLSLPRVLYHNPFTNVSSPWLRYGSYKLTF